MENIKSKLRKTLMNLYEGDSKNTKTDLKAAYNALKIAKEGLKNHGKYNADIKELTKAQRKIADEIAEMEDSEKTEMEEMKEMEVEGKNENSEGYGTFKGLGMNESKKVVKINESTLKRIVHRVMEETEVAISPQDRLVQDIFDLRDNIGNEDLFGRGVQNLLTQYEEMMTPPTEEESEVDIEIEKEEPLVGQELEYKITDED